MSRVNMNNHDLTKSRKSMHKSSRSVLPSLRSTKNVSQIRSNQADSNLKAKQSTSVTPRLDGESSTTTRNITPIQRPPRNNNATMGLPALMSSGTQRSKEMYTRNFTLDIDNQTYSTRQNAHYVGGFYKRLISNRVLQTNQPSPLLAPETVALSASLRKGNMSVRHANLSRTIQDVPTGARIN